MQVDRPEGIREARVHGDQCHRIADRFQAYELRSRAVYRVNHESEHEPASEQQSMALKKWEYKIVVLISCSL